MTSLGSDGQFPRSATMRLILKNPEWTLGLALPAAAVLLKSPASRRLLLLGLQLGARRPELQRLAAGAVKKKPREGG